MTINDWLLHKDPHSMFKHVMRSDRSTTRKLTLFACACCRLIWNEIDNSTLQSFITIVEKYADGSISESEMDSAFNRAEHAYDSICNSYPTSTHQAAAFAALQVSVSPIDVIDPVAAILKKNQSLHRQDANCISLRGSDTTFASADFSRFSEVAPEPLNMIADILRDIFPHPSNTVNVDMTWITPSVQRVACEKYCLHSFFSLRDLIRDPNARIPHVILEHCASGERHVRGCWVIEEIIGHFGKNEE